MRHGSKQEERATGDALDLEHVYPLCIFSHFVFMGCVLEGVCCEDQLSTFHLPGILMVSH